LSELVGEIAAIGTALFFGLSSTFFTLAGRRAGSTTVNRARLLLASAIAIALHWLLRGEPLPLSAPLEAWGWLALSGVVGLALGDDLLFRAYVLVGPALSMLVFAMAPVMAAFAGWAIFGEALTAREWAGIALTLSGIAWVVTEPKRRSYVTSGRAYVAGLLFALGGAAGQAAGLVTAKLGLVQGVAAQSANLMRLLAATVAIWTATAISGRVAAVLGALRDDGRTTLLTLGGALSGPVAGVWLSLLALERAPVGIASTLMSLTPIFLLPIVRVVFAESITARALAGTIVAVAGVALLLS
jgi:drug/metabolite transporter (DMT)-like permease